MQCNIFSPKKVGVTALLLEKDPLQFESRKRPPPVSDHRLFAFWVVAYWSFDRMVLSLRIRAIKKLLSRSKLFENNSRINFHNNFYALLVVNLQSWIKVLGTVLQYSYFSVTSLFPLKTVHPFRNFLAVLLLLTLYKVETRKKFWTHASNIVCGVRRGVGPV